MTPYSRNFTGNYFCGSGRPGESVHIGNHDNHDRNDNDDEYDDPLDTDDTDDGCAMPESEMPAEEERGTNVLSGTFFNNAGTTFIGNLDSHRVRTSSSKGTTFFGNQYSTGVGTGPIHGPKHAGRGNVSTSISRGRNLTDLGDSELLTHKAACENGIRIYENGVGPRSEHYRWCGKVEDYEDQIRRMRNSIREAEGIITSRTAQRRDKGNQPQAHSKERTAYHIPSSAARVNLNTEGLDYPTQDLIGRIIRASRTPAPIPDTFVTQLRGKFDAWLTSQTERSEEGSASGKGNSGDR